MKKFFKSYSKINTNLRVLKYKKKYKKFQLKSNVSILKLADNLIIRESFTNKILYIDGNTDNIINIKNCIIKKLIKYFDKTYGTKTNLFIQVSKFIPMGYGLGGGSSNAAIVLKYLYSLHSINDKYFNKDALSIGSDVSLFKDIYPKSIDGLTRLKRVYKVRYEWKTVYLILPGKRNPTKSIFKIYKKIKISNINLSKLSINDLLLPALSYNFELKAIISFLNLHNSSFKKYGMTGSGSAVFIIFKDNLNSKKLFNEFRTIFPLASIEKSEYFS